MSSNKDITLLDQVLSSSSHFLLHGNHQADKAIRRLETSLRCLPLDLRGSTRLEEIRLMVKEYVEGNNILWVLISPEPSSAVRSVLADVLDGRLVNNRKTIVKDELRLIAVCPEQTDLATSSIFPLAMATNAAMRPASKEA